MEHKDILAQAGTAISDVRVEFVALLDELDRKITDAQAGELREKKDNVHRIDVAISAIQDLILVVSTGSSRCKLILDKAIGALENLQTTLNSAQVELQNILSARSATAGFEGLKLAIDGMTMDKKKISDLLS
jgi:ethanolamine utilization microcompartment shell protein EutL